MNDIYLVRNKLQMQTVNAAKLRQWKWSPHDMVPVASEHGLHGTHIHAPYRFSLRAPEMRWQYIESVALVGLASSPAEYDTLNVNKNP